MDGDDTAQAQVIVPADQVSFRYMADEDRALTEEDGSS